MHSGRPGILDANRGRAIRKLTATLTAAAHSRLAVVGRDAVAPQHSASLISGPQGLRAITGFHDEALKGERKGQRSSRLNEQYRVIYEISAKEVLVYVLELTAHDYRRK